MEEKNLTDEEIIKAVAFQCGRSIPYLDEYTPKNVPFDSVLDLIHRLQSENKELKSPKFASWKLKFFNLKEEFDKELAKHEEFTQKAKAEIERLTEDCESADAVLEAQKHLIDLIKKDKVELQKQVDELEQRYLEESKERLEFEQRYKKIQHAHNIGLGSQRSQWEKKVKQAVKDTAKEIYEQILEWIPIGENYSVFIHNIEQWLKEKYEMEVE